MKRIHFEISLMVALINDKIDILNPYYIVSIKIFLMPGQGIFYINFRKQYHT